MNFEHALEAMRHGKKARRMSWNDGSYICFNSAGDIVDENGWLFLLLEIAKSGGWEIYEEPQKEPKMTDEKACKILDLILDYINVGEFEYITHCSFSEIAESVRMAIEALENQNQTKLFFDVGNISEKEFEELQRKLKECKLEVNPEKKCECECKCNHTVVDDDMQELMKQALVRKFFELEKEDFLHNETQAAIYTMFEIYKILYP